MLKSQLANSLIWVARLASVFCPQLYIHDQRKDVS